MTRSTTMHAPTKDPGLRIREADAQDTAAILRLYRQLVQPVAPEVEVDVRAERIEQIRSDPYNFLWVLESEEGVVGTLSLRFVWIPCSTGSLMLF